MTHPMSVRAIGYFLIGHVQHHVGVVRQRYWEMNPRGRPGLLVALRTLLVVLVWASGS